jgi:hypothetical protein
MNADEHGWEQRNARIAWFEPRMNANGRERGKVWDGIPQGGTSLPDTWAHLVPLFARLPFIAEGFNLGLPALLNVMQLSDTEKMFVARLKKRQASWIRWRWGFVLIAVLKLGCGVYGIVIVEGIIQEPSSNPAMIIAIIMPIVFAMMIAGMLLLAYGFANWNGKPETVLLLRLIDEARDDND